MHFRLPEEGFNDDTAWSHEPLTVWPVQIAGELEIFPADDSEVEPVSQTISTPFTARMKSAPNAVPGV